MKKIFLLFFALLLFSHLATAQSNHTITINGGNDFTAGTEKITGTSSGDWYFTWDATNFYFAVSNGDIDDNSDKKWVVLYIDTDPQVETLTGNGSGTGVTYNTQTPGLPFNADFHFRWKNNNGYTNMLDYNGGSWTSDNTAANNFSIAAFQSGTFVEFSIPRASLGNPSKIYVAGAMLNETGGGESTFFMFPAGKNSDGYDADQKSFYEFSLNAGVNPNNFDNYGFRTQLTYTNSTNGSWDNGTPDANAHAVFFNNNGCGSPTSRDITGTSAYKHIICQNCGAPSFSSAATVSSKGSVQLTSNATLVSNGFLTLQSDATNTAYIKSTAGGISGEVILERHTTDNGVVGASYRYLSAPFTDATVADVTATGFTLETAQSALFNSDWSQSSWTNFPNFFTYDTDRIATGSENNRFYKGWRAATAGSESLTKGRGFNINIAQAQDVVMGASANLSNTTVSGVTKADASTYKGWHLLGNPFLAPISVTTFLTANSSDIEGSAYVRTASGQYTGTYQSINSAGVSSPGGWDGTLAIGQGFFVQAKQTGDGSVDMDINTLPTYTNSAKLFRQQAKVKIDGLMRLSLASGDKHDEAVVMFTEQATPAFDSPFDAYKFDYNPKGYPTLFSKLDDTMLSINSLPTNFESAAPVALNMWLETAGTQTFTLTEWSHFEAGVKVYLEDKTLNITTELSANATYSFEAGKGMVEGRFFLHFNKEEMPFAENLNIFSFGKTINVAFSSAEQAAKASVAVFSLSGQQVASYQNADRVPALSMNPSINAGMYIVQVQTATGTFAKKVFVE